MNINLTASKETTVLIYDDKENVVQRFILGAVGLETSRGSKEQTLKLYPSKNDKVDAKIAQLLKDPEEEKNEAPRIPGRFIVGSRKKHIRFGAGTIIDSYKYASEPERVVVNFDVGGEMILLANLTQLKDIDDIEPRV